MLLVFLAVVVSGIWPQILSIAEPSAYDLPPIPAARSLPVLNPAKGVILNLRPAYTDVSKLQPWLAGIGYIRIWGGSRGMATYPTLESVPAALRQQGSRFNIIRREEIDQLLRLQRESHIGFIYLLNINDSLESQRAFVQQLLDAGMKIAMLGLGNEIYLRKFTIGDIKGLGVSRRNTIEDYIGIMRDWVPELRRRFRIPVYVCAAGHGPGTQVADEERRRWNLSIKTELERDPTLTDGVTFHRYGGEERTGNTHEETISNEGFAFTKTFGDWPIAITDSGYQIPYPPPENLERAADFWTSFLGALKPGDVFGLHLMYNRSDDVSDSSFGLYGSKGITPIGERFALWLDQLPISTMSDR